MLVDFRTNWALSVNTTDLVKGREYLTVTQLAVGSLAYEGGLGLQVLSRTGGAFAPGNLEGDWSFNVLAAGDAPQVNAWHYGAIKFNNAGFVCYAASGCQPLSVATNVVLSSAEPSHSSSSTSKPRTEMFFRKCSKKRMRNKDSAAPEILL